MKRSLRGDTQPRNMEEMKMAAASMDPAMMGNIQAAMAQYGGKSEAELMQELSSAKQSGLIDPNELAAMAGRLAPMLTAEQRQRLESVLSQLR